MNGFDFDGTLYSGDSSVDFTLYAMRRQPRCMASLPAMFVAAISRVLGRKDTRAFKQTVFGFLAHVHNLDELLEDFWDTQWSHMNRAVVERLSEGDIVISASPEFLLQIPCRRLGAQLIGTCMDPATGHISGANCKGKEKIARLQAAGINPAFPEFYTDSKADAPLVALAEKAFLVGKDGNITSLQEANLR